MKGTFGIVLMICSPFIVGGLFIAGLKAIDAYHQWRYERWIAQRNAKLERYGITPFRGTKRIVHDDLY